MDLKADVSTAMVTELSPKTDYSLTVYAMYPGLIGDSATIKVKTSECLLMHLVSLFLIVCCHLSLSNKCLSFSAFARSFKLPCY